MITAPYDQEHLREYMELEAWSFARGVRHPVSIRWQELRNRLPSEFVSRTDRSREDMRKNLPSELLSKIDQSREDMSFEAFNPSPAHAQSLADELLGMAMMGTVFTGTRGELDTLIEKLNSIEDQSELGEYVEELYIQLIAEDCHELNFFHLFLVYDDAVLSQRLQLRQANAHQYEQESAHLMAITREDGERASRLPNKSRIMGTHHDLVVKTLRKHTEALALPLGRKVGSPGHAVAREYLLHRLERMHLAPFHGESFELTYEGPHPNTKELQKFYNLVGVIPGKDRTLPPILLGAHYDSVIAAPCVDDNATSVALNLALAEYYALRPLDRDLILAFFDAEEPPFFLGPAMGSRRFCEDYCKDLRFAAVIVSDLIGHDFSVTDLSLPPLVDVVAPHFRKLLAVMGAETCPLFPEIVEKAAKRSKGLGVFPTLSRYVGPVSDHAAFERAGFPILFLSCGQGKHYHSPKDDLEWINFDKLGRITAFVADLIEQINATPRHPETGPRDPFDVDIRMLRDALGLALPLGLKALGREIPTSREELDSLIENALSNKLKHQ